MGESVPEIIDIFTHIAPEKYNEALWHKAAPTVNKEINATVPALVDLGERFKIMDSFGGYRQVLTIVQPGLETVVGKEDAVYLAALANDQLAELVQKYPDRFVGAVACLPMNDVGAALKEAEKAVREKNFKGVQIYTPANGKPLDYPDFMEIYSLMAEFDLPIWIHPTGEPSVPDYPGEDESKYGLFASLGWPYQTSLAMVRLVCGGVFDRYPDLKFVIHHCGAMISFFLNRLSQPRPWLKEPPVEYFKKFYVDTAVDSNAPALMCGYSLWGADHVLFGTDSPFGGEEKVARCLATVNSVDIPADSKSRILYKNARKLLRL